MARQDGPKRKVKTTDTVFDIVETLQKLDGATVTEVADYLDLANSTVYDHLTTLKSKRYVVQKSDEYQLGLRFLGLGMDARSQRKLWEPTEPVVRRLSETTGEGVRLWVEEHGRSVLMGCALGDQAVELPPFDTPGSEGFMHCHAGGKAILAHLPDLRVDEIIERYGLPQQTDHTITDPDRLSEELEEVHERGFVFEKSEVIPDVRSVAVPITVNDTVLGSISIAAPASRMQDEYYERDLPNELLAAVEEIRLRLVDRIELDDEAL